MASNYSYCMQILTATADLTTSAFELGNWTKCMQHLNHNFTMKHTPTTKSSGCWSWIKVPGGYTIKVKRVKSQNSPDSSGLVILGFAFKALAEPPFEPLLLFGRAAPGL